MERTFLLPLDVGSTNPATEPLHVSRFPDIHSAFRNSNPFPARVLADDAEGMDKY